jgi:hypothetical protein
MTCTLTRAEGRYLDRLRSMPAPGGGGCHAALLGVATLGIMAGRDDGTLLADIRAAIPRGTRRVPDGEITAAIRRAHMDTDKGACTGRRSSRQAPIHIALRDPAEAEACRKKIIDDGGGDLHPDCADIWESSPIRLHHPFTRDAVVMIESLYHPDDLLFIGRRYDGRENVRTAAAWARFFWDAVNWIEIQPKEQHVEFFARLGDTYPHIIPNPLTGHPAPTASGDKMTWRGDACIKDYRYILAEFDDLPWEQQGGVLRGLCRHGLRIAALLHSGGKSIHAWLTVSDIATPEEWQATVKGELFQLLALLGVDRACSNPARLSRLPGVYRRDKGWQRMFYLAPEGGALI